MLLDPDSWEVAYLYKMKVVVVAKTHDSERRAIISVYALVCKAEKANAIFADLKAATAVTA